MSLRHRSFSNGASMAQGTLRLRHRRPKGKPMAQGLRLWVFPIGAPMAHRRTFGKRIPTVFAQSGNLFNKCLPEAQSRRWAPLVFNGWSFSEIAKRAVSAIAPQGSAKPRSSAQSALLGKQAPPRSR